MPWGIWNVGDSARPKKMNTFNMLASTETAYSKNLHRVGLGLLGRD